MKKLIIAGLTLLSLTAVCKADDSTQVANTTGWKLSLDGAFAATQSSYSSNWQGGELGSFNWSLTSNSKAEKQMSSKVNWSNTLKVAFGLTYSQRRLTDGSTRWLEPEKNTDLIDFESVARLTLHGFVDPYVAGRLQTSFYDASVRSVRRYFSPATVTESGGVLRMFADGSASKANTRVTLKSRLGVALRQIVTSVITGDTVSGTTESITTNDGGVESVSDLEIEIGADFKYTGKLTLYKALSFSESDVSLNDDWKSIDMNWEHIVTAKVAKFIQTSLYVQLLYDKQLDKGVRIKQTLGMGVAVNIL